MSDALEPIRAVDAADQLGDVLALPDHLRDALWRVESLGLEAIESSGLVVCGMGGSAIGGDLARAAIGDRLLLPLSTVRGYALSPATPPDRAVLCSSYSGNTEETLACFAAAEALGARRIVATTGGSLGEAARAADVPVIGLPAALQPRAAAGYMFVVAAEAAALTGAAPPLRTEIDAAASHLAEASGKLAAQAGELADRIGAAVPAIYGCDLTAPVAYRWKTQINENAKRHAFFHLLPELDHNELVAWDDSGDDGEFAAIMLTDCDQHPRNRRRAELTGELIAPAAADVIAIETEGETRTERMLRALMLGDLLSLQMAARRGIDPSPVAVIERLKDELAKS